MTDIALKEDIHEFVEHEWENIIRDIARLVAIESVEDLSTATKEMPFGKAPWQALSQAMDIARDMGLDVHNCEGYMAYAELKGESEKHIATIAHTDIVPLGTGWTCDPLKVTRKDGYLIGRGVVDDKGPAVLSLYIAKYLKDRQIALPYGFRCILGCNEETSMADVEYYTEHYPLPVFLFSPDADFPLCYGEKGGYTATLISDNMQDGNIVDFHGGIADNAIPADAFAIVKTSASNLAFAEYISWEDLGDGTVKISAKGIAGHASKPEGTRNAIYVLVCYLLDQNLVTEQEKEFLELQRQILSSTDGSSFGIACQDEYFTPLTCIGGTVRTVDGHFEQTIDSRYPTSITGDEITYKLKAVADAHNAQVRVDLNMECFLTDPTSEPIQVLLQTYNEVKGRNDKGFTMGGGTYARHFPCACSFGPNDPQNTHPDWVGSEHSADEGVAEQELKDALELYILSVLRLMKLKF